jgi:hypothetical protein
LTERVGGLRLALELTLLSSSRVQCPVGMLYEMSPCVFARGGFDGGAAPFLLVRLLVEGREAFLPIVALLLILAFGRTAVAGGTICAFEGDAGRLLSETCRKSGSLPWTLYIGTFAVTLWL